ADYKGIFESKLNFTSETAGSDVPSSYNTPLNYTSHIYESNNDMIMDGVDNYLFGLNGETLEINLSDISNKISKTLYSKRDNNNIFTGQVTEYQFKLITNNFITQKIIFGNNKSVSILDNGALNVHPSQNELILSTNKNYLIKIDNNNIKIY